MRKANRHHNAVTPRSGQVLVLVAVSLTAIFGMLALVIDSAILMAEYRHCQNATDAAGTAAVNVLADGGSLSAATSVAEDFVHDLNDLAGATVTLSSPPSEGPFAGRTGFVEVVVSNPASTFFAGTFGDDTPATIRTVSVAGIEAVPVDQALIVLDPSPEAITVLSVTPAIPTLPVIIGGQEVEGLGRLIVDGRVAINNEWGGVDEAGQTVSTGAGPPYALAATPFIGTSKLLAEEIRVTGGVDTPSSTGHVDPAKSNPLKANQSPVADPFRRLPVPVASVDPVNVDTTLRGGVTIAGLPIGLPVTLEPGIYEWIHIISGKVNFEPGIYVIRSAEPLDGISLLMTGGRINAEGVMFYVTNSSTYDAVTGLPDSVDGDSEPPASLLSALTPSVVLVEDLFPTMLTGLDDPSSPFDGITIYQRRHDRRPIVIVQSPVSPIGGSHKLAGAVYAKWGHLMLVGSGVSEFNAVVGTMRAALVGDLRITPEIPLPPSPQIFLVQ